MGGAGTWRPGRPHAAAHVDHGADEYVLCPSAADAQVLVLLLHCGKRVMVDLDRKVLMFGNVSTE